jgi:hypothetical protein
MRTRKLRPAGLSLSAFVLENIVLNLIVTVYFNATLAGVVVLFAMHTVDELRNS